MRDSDIRAALCERLRREHEGDLDTLILEELGLCQHTSRVDVAVINGLISGYEIKSDRDTLARLASQGQTYEQALDRVTLVVGTRHLEKAKNAVPSWWGLIVARKDKAHGVKLESMREAENSPKRQALAVAQLLWRDEALALLCQLEQARGLSNATRGVLWQKLTEVLSLEELSDQVRQTIKARGDWREKARRQKEKLEQHRRQQQDRLAAARR